ncbi:hypothetical protein Syun_017191 [Stephania yunnanensis]|uniref:Uncharacterized protein n=1 Tax=Stephania yunnanensis TaxID=152371 RepID=A0AAP0P344_9MAGN
MRRCLNKGKGGRAMDGFRVKLRMKTRPIIPKHLDVSEAMERMLPSNDRATGEDARALEDAFEDVNDVHDSNSTCGPLTAPTEEFDATPTSSRMQTTTADDRGNEAKKKRNVSNDVYIGDQMVAAA